MRDKCFPFRIWNNCPTTCSWSLTGTIINPSVLKLVSCCPATRVPAVLKNAKRAAAKWPTAFELFEFLNTRGTCFRHETLICFKFLFVCVSKTILNNVIANSAIHLACGKKAGWRTRKTSGENPTVYAWLTEHLIFAYSQNGHRVRLHADSFDSPYFEQPLTSSCQTWASCKYRKVHHIRWGTRGEAQRKKGR